MAEAIRRKRIQVNKQMTDLQSKLDIKGLLMTEERQKIVETKPMELLSKLKNDQLSAIEVLRAFQAKALEVTGRINCITEFVPDAEVWAEACDALPLEDRGPLHGMPVSIKESINIIGMDTTIGLSKLLYNPATSNALIVDILIQKGAIPFCKTNIPQAMYSFCCTNPVYGITLNPHDLTRIPGGSSGGEGALIGAGGSVLGIGSDLAGSIRVPCTFSGCAGLKPTSSRTTAKGIKKILPGLRGTESAIGVMGRDPYIIAECMRALCSGSEMSKEDFAVVPLPWNELMMNTTRKLRFGYFDSIDIFPTMPGPRRAVHVAKEALERAGHEVVPFQIENAFDLLIGSVKFLRADNGKTLYKHLEGEILDPFLWKYLQQSTKSDFWKPIQKLIIKRKSKLAAEFIFHNDACQTYGYWKSLYERQKNIDRFIRSMKQKNIDLILSPTFPVPAPQEEITSVITYAYVYTVIFNYLDFPSGVVPVTRETEEDQRLLQSYPEDDMLFRLSKKATFGAAGLPHGVTITGKPWEEELVCRGMIDLQEAIN